jgi:hypothetical protein
MTSATPSAAELADIEACRSLVIEFASLIDENRTNELIHLLMPESTFARPTAPDVVVSGAENIIKAFASRPKDLITQHLNVNIRITLTGADTATGESVVVLYRASANDPLEAGKGRKATGPLLGTWSDSSVRTKQGWRFKDRRGQVTMYL